MFDTKVSKFKEFLIKKDSYIILESEGGFIDKDQERKARIRVNKAVIWINVNRGFFGRLLANLNIYGSSALNPKTMATNGLNIIYHPEFVMRQNKGGINFVLCHEILHCLGDHMTRRGTRDPEIWNHAADYAINPILDAEVGRDFEWPKKEDGTRMGLFEEKYSGMRAEDIYDDLIKKQKEGSFKPGDSKDWDFGNVEDSTKDMPAPDSENSVVQDARAEEGEEGKERGKGAPGEEGDGDEEGESGTSNIVGKRVTITDGPHKGESGIVKEVLPNGDIII